MTWLVHSGHTCPFSEVITAILSISAWSIGGVASRIAILSLVDEHNFFPDSSVISVNVIGSFIIGLVAGCTQLAESLPLTYLGITSGFCGSLTTFSSWIYGILETDSSATVEVLTGLSMPLVAFLIAEDFGSSVSVLIRDKTDTKLSTESTKAIDKALVSMTALGSVLSLIMISTIGAAGITNEQLVACALGPFGALTRYALSRALNRKTELFMIGTLAANLLAVIILGSLVNCSVTNAWCSEATVGICGSLSTVSSWVLETVKIYRKNKAWAYFYSLISLGTCVVVLIPFVQG